ncbi:acyl-CoA synthetase [Mycobacterium intracellulare]|uniref:Acyl-CoA synthetase n=1 Tax=Mycobacterium intracellulare subsp. chimaera TaxID=222805 RepID=A0A7U5MIM3_MYCIT|nr:acyl-CoA synthetase [Mycobacterium intracellulare]ASL14197.1 acyl-CoA synthetase [Mycobacterium intracellulare subsp. chimaera]ASQ89078.1 acyl-CoA synthetase [Mycobacterium intracellulare subsp. chimaera]MCF1811233.1 acyl-CoA synthetase [Mycobacterium intracellulare subsp. intracellulare]MDM3925156.1 acyl-CoA synthetase [Mycobacterium intracellulare subsp. chimaera]MDS0334014.1 acyl-CoA synthetase [Mycobacterium intracellulare]
MSDTTTTFTVPAVAKAVAAAIPDRELIIHGDRRYTYAQVIDRSNRLAAYLHSQGLGCHTERDALAGHEVGQDLLGLYAYNGNEFVEALLGSFQARVAPFNVNFRYVKSELQYLLADSGATALLYHAALAPRVAEILPDLPQLRVLIQIADDSGNDLLDGAIDYEAALASVSPEPPPVQHSADDLYVLYTGGTTGMPKGVLWRQHDIFMTSFGGRNLMTGEPSQSIDEIVERAAAGPGTKLMILPPLIHGAAQWSVMTAITTGQSVVFPTVVDHLDADDVVRTIEREKVAVVTVVGDAMARPLVAAIEKGIADVSSLAVVANGGALLTPYVKQRLIEVLPNAVVVDGVGSSETGAQMHHMSTSGAVATGTFNAGPDTFVAAEDLTAILEPGHEGMGWLAQRGYVPLGYKGDAAKTAKTFPVIDGVRYAVPGDRARHGADGSVELLGRDSVTINSGGEKIFVEEVETAIASHPAVADVVVAGRPSERWGQEVVAVVALAQGARAEADELVAHASNTLARYKLPKAIVFRPVIERSPSGKADYRWAREQAVSG